MTILPLPDRQPHVERERLLQRITGCIRRSLALQEILESTAAEVRSFLDSDRVMIYQFHPDGSGQVIAESIHQNRLPSLRGLNFPADDIPLQARELFIREKMCSIVDLDSQQIGHCSPYYSQRQAKAENLEYTFESEFQSKNFEYRPLDPCHAEYLTAMGVRASLTVPVFHHDQLWGLLVAHHTQAKTIPADLLRGVQMVADQLAVAIVQSALLTQAREKAEREVTLNRITALLHSFETIELQKALEEAVAAFQGSGGRLFIEMPSLAPQDSSGGTGTEEFKLYTCGMQPVPPDRSQRFFLERCSAWQAYFQTGDRQVWSIADLYQIPTLVPLQDAFKATAIRSILIVPLQVRQQLTGYLSIFRDEIETKTLWAGQFDPDGRQLYPRLSFEAWCESKGGQVRAWTDGDLLLVQALGKEFAAAIEQNALYQHIRSLNVNLESQVQERTASLQQATEQQRMLFEVVVEMRKSLDLNVIFTTVTREVRRILQVDRVGVYRFGPDSALNEGEFVAEDVVSEFPSALSVQIHDHCFGELYAALYRQGRVHAIDDIHSAELQGCYVSLLDRFHVKATIVIPLMQGEELWGLFCVHQCAHPREWQLSEIQFVSQVAEQLGVALSQANLLAQTQQQKEQLAQTLHDLQTAQAQLIQTEKMSSLGQLVAGIAHEINNPVNFIYGNLSHITAYAEDLLALIALYQRCYPSSNAEIQQRAEDIDLQFLAEDLPKTLASMKMGADRIRKIVLSLRNFSRLDQAEMKRVDIHEGIDSTLLILQHRLKAKSDAPEILVIRDYGDLPLVECYAGQLNQVFMNLISNAIDSLEEWNAKRSRESFAANPATIHIRTARINAKRIAIFIADNGSGMPESVRHHLFDPFFTTKPVGKGTGLGLSISYQIVTEKHGGSLQCVSALGKGAEFMIEIPVEQNSH